MIKLRFNLHGSECYDETWILYKNGSKMNKHGDKLSVVPQGHKSNLVLEKQFGAIFSQISIVFFKAREWIKALLDEN